MLIGQKNTCLRGLKNTKTYKCCTPEQIMNVSVLPSNFLILLNNLNLVYFFIRNNIYDLYSCKIKVITRKLCNLNNSI